MIKHRLVLMALATTVAGGIRTDANPVLDWNAITAQVVLAPGARPGATPILDFAVVQAAVHDTVQAYDKRFEPYAVDFDDAPGSVAAAIAKVCHDVLVNRFPSQEAALDATYDNYLADHGLAPDDPGVAVGQEVAEGIIALRAGDGVFQQFFRHSSAQI